MDANSIVTPGKLRKACAADIQAIVELVRQNLDRILPRSVEDIREMIDYFWVIEEGDRLVGCACLEVYSHKICEIRTLVVAADCYGKGYGSMLVDAAVAEAKRRKIPQILAITSSKEFFEKLNFTTCLNEKFALFWNGNKGAAAD